MIEVSNVVYSQNPVFEAFRIGAWWYTRVSHKKGNNYLVYSEGYGLHEEQALTSKNIRLRSRRAQSSDCQYLTLGTDVVAFVVHPNTLTAELDKGCYSAWYDVKIISKVYKHPLYACACKYTVQFYSDWAKLQGAESTRALLEGTMVDVSITEIAIMQAPVDSPLELLFEKSFSFCEEKARWQWSKDVFTLNLTCSGQGAHAADCRQRDEDLENEFRTHLQQNNTYEHLKNGNINHILNNHRKAIANCQFVDLTSSDDHSIHAETSLSQDISLPSQVVCKSKRRKMDIPDDIELTDAEFNVETLRKQKLSQHNTRDKELAFYSSDAGSSRCKCIQSCSNSEKSPDCTHTCLQEEESKGQSQSRSTPVFFGNAIEGNSIVESVELHDRDQGEDQGGSSTNTFYGNTSEKSGHSGSTAVFYGFCADENYSSTEEGTLDLKKMSKSPVSDDQEHMCKCAKICYADHNTMDEAESNSTGGRQRDSALCRHEVDDNSQSICSIVQISSEHSQSGCRGCKFLAADDNIHVITSDGESIESKSNSCRKRQDGYGHCSECQPACKYDLSKKRKKDQQKQKCKQNCKRNLGPNANKRLKQSARVRSKARHTSRSNLGPNANKRLKQNARVRSQARHTSRSKDRDRGSRAKDKENYLNDLFHAILKSARELRHVKMAAPSTERFPPNHEEAQNQLAWEPIIFHGCTDMYMSSLKKPDPLTDLWKDMELASHEVSGVAVLAEKQSSSSEDKALCCDHSLVLNELEGHVCAHCGLLVTSIENVLAPVLQGENRKFRDNKMEAEKEGVSSLCTNSIEHQTIPRLPLKTDLEAAWQLIEGLKPLLQKHQIDGFNFLWKNVGALGKQADKEGGGCIVAHAPGTGKSLLIISFLKSFLHLHSWCRPLIVAPKNMLLSWKNEFEKWKAGVRTYLLTASSPLTYLSTISEWQKNTSVLIINYQLFSHLVDERRVCKTFDIQQIGRLLLHIPDILVLDEGHVPRNCSRLRESLLQIRTRFKILVSGTLFHNNVQELFNLLYLARPNFLSHLQTPYSNIRFDEIDVDIDNNPKQWQTFEDFDKERSERASNDQLESKLRKVFMEEIGNRFADKVQEESRGVNDFKHAIEKLRGIMAPFTHFYNGDILNSLPGIKECIVVLQATSLQISLSKQIEQQTFLETALSIHPSLLLKWKGPKLSSSIDLDELQAIREDPWQGPKVKFILDIADCCHLLKEKLLIFSQFITTMELVAEMLQKKFQVAMIKGQDRLEERQRTIEDFNESTGASILLASLTACGEGINLTGASRLVFLDMHWNPARMKQAVARAFRIGQERVVHTYWLIASVEKEAEKFTRIHRKDWLSRNIFASGAEFMTYNRSEVHLNVEVEDFVLAQLLRNDKNILKVLNYSASEREKPYAFFEQCGFPGR